MNTSTIVRALDAATAWVRQNPDAVRRCGLGLLLYSALSCPVWIAYGVAHGSSLLVANGVLCGVGAVVYGWWLWRRGTS